MAGVFYVHTMTMATDATVTSGVQLYDKAVLWSLEVPTMSAWCVTATCNVRLEGSTDGTTYRPIGYSNNPSTATSGFKNWEVGGDTSTAFVICEAAQFTPYVRVSTTNTATVAVAFKLIGKLIA